MEVPARLLASINGHPERQNAARRAKIRPSSSGPVAGVHSVPDLILSPSQLLTASPETSEAISWFLLLLIHLNTQNLGMPMHIRHQTHANRSSDRLRHSSLVDRSESRLVPMLNPPHVCHVFRHDAEVLCLISGQPPSA